MRKITNVNVPQPEKSKDENNLFSLVLDEDGIIVSIDKTCKRESSYDECLGSLLRKIGMR